MRRTPRSIHALVAAILAVALAAGLVPVPAWAGQAGTGALVAQSPSLSELQAAVDAAKREKDAADSEVDAAQATLDAINAQISSGSFGFFAANGSTSAVNALNNATYASYTHKGSASDATSLDNVKAALKWLAEYNDIMVAAGLQPLEVSDLVMAHAESNANYYAGDNYSSQHADQWTADETDNIGMSAPNENIRSPYDIWYYNEKETAEKDPSNWAAYGHYSTIISQEWGTSGFAVSQGVFGGKSGYTYYDQSFWMPYDKSIVSSIADYTAKFDAYVADLQSKLAAAKSALSAKQAAQASAAATLKAAQDALADASKVDTTTTLASGWSHAWTGSAVPYGGVATVMAGTTSVPGAQVSYAYSSSQEGTYSQTAPTSAGTWWVKGTYAGDSARRPSTSEAVSFQVEAIAPGAPAGLAAVAGDGRVTLSWEAPSSDGGSAITGWRVFRDGSAAPLDTLGPQTLSYVDTGLENGTGHSYVVAAVSAAGQGAGSAPASATPRGTTSVSLASGWVAAYTGSAIAYGGGAAVRDSSGAALAGAEVSYSYASSATGTFSSAAPTDAGAWWVRASYAGDGAHAGSSATAGFSIARAATAVELTPDLKVAYTGGAVAYPGWATVTSNGTVIPGAEVTYSYAASAVGPFSATAPSAAGTWYVRGTYAGDANHAASASAATGYTIEAQTAPEGTAMHRLYNPNSGEHFFTANASERDGLEGVGWTYEGVAWTAPSSGDPVYRLYNKYGGEHHYTTSASERDGLVGAGWAYEGVGWRSSDAQATPLHRLYNPNAFANNHHYTTDTKERDWLVSLGWRYEGVGWYGL